MQTALFPGVSPIVHPLASRAFHRLPIYIQVTPSVQQWSIFRCIAGKHAFAIFQRLCW